MMAGTRIGLEPSVAVGSTGPGFEGGSVDSVALAYGRAAGETAEGAQAREQAV